MKKFQEKKIDLYTLRNIGVAALAVSALSFGALMKIWWDHQYLTQHHDNDTKVSLEQKDVYLTRAALAYEAGKYAEASKVLKEIRHVESVREADALLKDKYVGGQFEWQWEKEADNQIIEGVAPAWVYVRQSKKSANPEVILRRGLDRFPLNAHLRIAYGDTLTQTGNYDDAKEQYKIAMTYSQEKNLQIIAQCKEKMISSVNRGEKTARRDDVNKMSTPELFRDAVLFIDDSPQTTRKLLTEARTRISIEPFDAIISTPWAVSSKGKSLLDSWKRTDTTPAS